MAGGATQLHGFKASSTLWRDDIAAAATSAAGWQELPADILCDIGARLSSPGAVSAASLACKSWCAALPAGVRELELDMHPSGAAWDAKVDQLAALTPGLISCRAHVASAVPVAEFSGRLGRLCERLRGIQHLHLELSEGFQLMLDGGDDLLALGQLRSLTLSGGTFAPSAAEALLRALAAACPGLEELRLLPEARCGIGDAEVALLGRLRCLRVLEFRASRLSAAGLTRLTAQLPALASLSAHGLDTCLDAATTACFAAQPSLQQLHLGMDYELAEPALQQLRDVAGDLSMRFRWTDKVAGLLRTASFHLQARLVSLDLGCVRLSRDPAACLLEPLAGLTALSDLRMSLHSNSDDQLTLHLSQLSALSNLQVLHLTKQHAYFPERRRMAESSIAVPLSAGAAAALAEGCQRLRSLRLCLGASDVTAEGLAGLRCFSGLRSLSVSAEPFGSPPQPVPLDLLTLPRGLTALELRNVDIITPPTEFAQPPHLASRQSGEGRGGGGGQRGTWSRGAAAASTLHAARPHGIIALPAPPAAAPPAAARLTPLLPPPEDAPVLALGALPAAVAQAAPPLQQPAVAPMPRAAGRATPPGVLAAPARRGCEDVADVLSQLCSLKLESCRLRLPQLQALAGWLPALEQLQLAHVAGLCDAGVAALSAVTGLTCLSVAAPHNRQLTQASLAALAPLRGLRRLSWQSDDLAALGPVVAAFGAFTGLRLLSLSCTPDTLRRACGNTDRTGLQHAATTIGVARDESLLRELLPYADLELQRC